MSQTPIEPNTDAPARFQTGRVIAVAFAHFVHDSYTSFLAPLLPLIIEKLSISLTSAGLLSVFMQLPTLLNPYLGLLADRVSARLFVILAPSLTAACLSLIGVAPTYGVLVVLLLIAGLSVAAFHVPAPVMIAQCSGGQVGKGMSFFMTGGELSRTVGPLFAVGAVSLMGLEGFYPVMLLGFLASGWLFIKLKDIPVKIRTGKKKTSLGEAWREVRRLMIPMSGILIARGFMHASAATYLPTFINSETGNLWLAGFGLTALEAAGVVGVFTTGTLSDRIGRRRMLAISLFCAPVFLLLFLFTGGWVSFVSLMGLGLTLLSTTPVMMAMVQDTAVENPAAANGIFMMMSFLARSLVIIPVGIVGDHFGLKTAYVVCALVGFIGVPFLFRLPEIRKQ